MWDKTEVDEKEVSLSIDDLILEIGRKHIEGLIAEKKLNILKEKLNAVSLKLNSLAPDTSKLKESNLAYIENNKRLDDGITELRADNKNLKLQVVKLEAEHKKLQRNKATTPKKSRSKK
ncbi:MAG: hypothetical protein PF440_00140 [Thiomicrorhabdus sp.]|jgi:uncharacterized protein (DUF3084 family)|nr:hypothetical protein [Thiomicrorhabdus sp.]